MKKRYILYPLLMLLAMLLPTSCSVDNDININSNDDGGKVRFDIEVSLAGASGAESRAFGDGASADSIGSEKYYEFRNLYVAVFEENEGTFYFQELVKADGTEHTTTPTWNAESSNWIFSVELTQRENPCRLHLIANYDREGDEPLTMGFNEEGQLMGYLESRGENHDVYWNCINLANGISSKIAENLLNVPLVRNYVQIRLDTRNIVKGTNINSFEVLGYALYNVPKKGTVAAYNPSSTNKFANFANSTSCNSYANLYGTQKYEGNEAYDDGTLFDTTIPTENEGWNTPSTISYMYERKNRGATQPTCMLIKAKCNNTITYYKLDFVYQDGSNTVYYNLLRNFIYTMKMTKVEGLGYNSPEEALNEPANNNIGGDILAEDYTNVSNGFGQIYVSSTYMMFINTNQVELYYKSIPNIQNGTPNNALYNETSNPTGVTFTYLEGEEHVLSTVPAIATDDEKSGQYEGWRKITLSPNEPLGTDSKLEELIISANGLQRKVKLLLRKPEAIMVSVPEVVAPVIKTSFDVSIELPTGIAESLFPLQLFIRSAKNTIFPAYGQTIPTEVRDGVYGFIKTVTYEQAYKIVNGVETPLPIVCPFLTNCKNSATIVYVENEYLTQGSDEFFNTENGGSGSGSGSSSTDKITSLTITNAKKAEVPCEGRQGGSKRLPYKIYNAGANDGTQTVTVELRSSNGTLVNLDSGSSLTIKGTSSTTVQITGTLNYATGLSNTDELIFTFKDQYYKGNNGWSNEVTYTATCTVQQLKDNNNILTFSHPQ